MDAIKLLKEDHDKVKDLFKKFEKASSASEKKKIAEQVFHELEVHTKIEEEIFYPAVKSKGGSEGEELIGEANEEHHVVDVLIAEMKKIGSVDDQFEAKFTVMRENVEHHIEEEEGEMFPQARKVLKDELEELGEQMFQRKQKLMAAAR